VAFSQARDGDAEQRVKDCESGAAEQAELEIGKAKLGFDRLLNDADNDAIDEIEGVNDEKGAEDVAAIVFAAVALKGRRCCVRHASSRVCCGRCGGAATLGQTRSDFRKVTRRSTSS
jgi:hypothetical protein